MLVDAWHAGDLRNTFALFFEALEKADVETVLRGVPADLRAHVIQSLDGNDDDFQAAFSEASPRASSRIEEWRRARRAQHYRALATLVDRDDLHEVIAANGPEFLSRDLPYIIRACRWRELDRRRRERRESERFGEGTLDEDADQLEELETLFAALTTDRRLIRLRSVLARLPNVDVNILWKTAEGNDDATIAEALALSVDTVRQRRFRVLGRLRRMLGVTL